MILLQCTNEGIDIYALELAAGILRVGQTRKNDSSQEGAGIDIANGAVHNVAILLERSLSRRPTRSVHSTVVKLDFNGSP